MNETKKASKPVRRRRSVRKFRRFSNAPPAANDKREDSDEMPIDEESEIVDLDESRDSMTDPELASEEQTVQSESSSLDSFVSYEEERPSDPSIQPLESESEDLQNNDVLDDEDQATNPRIDLAGLRASEEKVSGKEALDDESTEGVQPEQRSSVPSPEPRDSSVPEDGTVKRTRVISIPPDPPDSTLEARSEALPAGVSQGDAEQNAIPHSELPETPIEEIEPIEEGDIEGFEEQEVDEVVVRDSDLTLESDEIEDDEAATEVEELTAESEDDVHQGVVEADQALQTEQEAKEELSEADLERAIEWVDEDSIDEIDQSDLIESKEVSELSDEPASVASTPVPEAEESIEIESIPSDYSARLSPPPSPPDTKTKRISARPPPHPKGNAHQAQASTSAQPSERVSSVSVTEEKTPARPAKTPRPWWESFFSEDYLRTVMPPTPPQVSKQCDFILASLGLERGSTILDVGCGLGLHAVELTVRGYLVVGLDLSLPMVTRAAEEAQYRGLKINFLHADIRQIEFEGAFDAVICLGTTFGFFDDESNRDVLSRLHGALKPGGKLLLDVVNRDFAIRSQPNLVWFQGDDCVCMEESEFNYSTSRLHVKRTVMQEDGRQSDSEYSIRLYSLHELYALLRQEGFRVLEVSGQEATRGIFFGMNAPRVLLLATRTNQRPSIHDALKWNSRTSKKPKADYGNK